MKSVLLHVYDDDALEGRFQAALDVCRAFDAHLTCLQVTPYNAYVSFEPLGGVYTQAALLDAVREREAEVRKRLEAHLGHDEIRWDWIDADGPVVEKTVAASALNDLLIVSQFPGPKDADMPPLPLAGDVALHAACPVLMIPAGVSAFDAGRPAVVAWNASPEAAKAIRSALPVLRAASSVHIVSVGEQGADLPPLSASSYLSRHGINSELHTIAAGHEDTATALAKFAGSRSAGCIVMGAYGRSRLRETLLGGVTRDLLRNSKISLLLAH